MLASVVEEVAAGLLGQRMRQQSASQRIAGDDYSLERLEVLPGFFLGPRRSARSERLETQRSARAMARNTAGVAGTLGEENRLNAGLEKLIVESRRGRGRLLDQQCSDDRQQSRDRHKG